MKLTKKNITLGLSLLATLLAVYFSPSAEGTDIALSEHSRNRTAANSSGGSAEKLSVRSSGKSADVLTIRSRELDEEDDTTVFSAAEWTPVASKMQATVPVLADIKPSEPQAPPLPFQVLGRYVENGNAAVFLQHNDQNLVVRVGDTIAEKYKVESLNTGTLTLRYLPLNLLQTLEIGSAT